MGGTNFVLFTACRLKQFVDVLVIAQRTSPAIQTKFDDAGVDLISLNSPSFTDKSFWLSYEQCIGRDRRAIENLIEPNDIVLSSMYPMNVIAQRLGHADIQVIYEPFSFFHDPDYIRNFGLFPAMFLSLMRRLHVEEEIAATKAAKSRLTLSCGEAERIRLIYDCDASVIYEGVDTELFNRNIEPHPHFTDRTIILHSTGFDRYKGTDLVLQAMPEIVRQHKEALLVVTYTRENPAILRSYRRQLEKAGIADSVKFLGTVPYDQLPSLYRAARVYVEPGWDRTMSLSVKEAMACGTPVVRGDAGWEEVEDGTEGYLVAPDDVSAYAERVARLLADDVLRKRMADAAVERVTRQFTWRAVADRIAGYAGLGRTEMQEAV
jgi:glycosyltransferase involved in cell wall biosynthesis